MGVRGNLFHENSLKYSISKKEKMWGNKEGSEGSREATGVAGQGLSADKDKIRGITCFISPLCGIVKAGVRAPTIA